MYYMQRVYTKIWKHTWRVISTIVS